MEDQITTKDLLAEIGELYIRNRRLSAKLDQERQARLHLVPPSAPEAHEETAG